MNLTVHKRELFVGMRRNPDRTVSEYERKCEREGDAPFRQSWTDDRADGLVGLNAHHHWRYVNCPDCLKYGPAFVQNHYREADPITKITRGIDFVQMGEEFKKEGEPNDWFMRELEKL